MIDYDKTIEAMGLAIHEESGQLCEEECMLMAKAALAALQETMPEPEKNDHLNEYDMLLFNDHYWKKLKNLGK